jgi:hypothetical protein
MKVIPRRGLPHNVIIQDEQTKEENVYFPVFTLDGNYLTFTLESDLIENRRYKLTITDPSDNTLYRDLLLTMSTQEVEDYTINKDEYEFEEEQEDKTKYKFI